MKHKHFKNLFAVLLILCTTTATAYEFRIDGICYNITSTENKTVEVDNIDYDYTGGLTIPKTITYSGTTYSVTSIGLNAFVDCDSLTSIEIPNSVTSIGDSAFRGCTGLTSITIPNSVTSISNNAFKDCTGLTSIEIPNSVTSIGWDAFRGCTGLTSITIPNSVTNIYGFAFYDCTGLKEVHISDLAAWCGISFAILSNANPLCYAKNLYLNGELVTELVIPEGIKRINDYAFNGCSCFTSIEIPNSVTSIGLNAFVDCTGLTSIEIPNSVTSIGDDAFRGCTGITSIEIPNSVTSIGAYAFYDCSGLTSITIPNSVTSIGRRAFYGCEKITEIKVALENPIKGEDDIFADAVYDNATLYIPNGTKSLYEKREPWNIFYNIVEMDFTGIDEVYDEVKGESGKQKGVCYDLSGHVVENPTTGIYIIGGKKVLIK